MKLILIALMLVVLWLPNTQAQENEHTPEEQTMITYVSQAIDNLYALKSYRMVGTQKSEAVITDESGRQVFYNATGETEMKIMLNEDGTLEALSIRITEETTSSSGNDPIKSEQALVVLNGLGYIQLMINGVSVLDNEWQVFRLEDLEGLPIYQVQSIGASDLNLPSPSVNLSENPMSDLTTSFLLPVSERTVISILELENRVIDNQTMYGFEIQMDYEGIREEIMQQQHLTLNEYGIPASGTDEPTMEDFLQEFQRAMTTTISINQKIWIGVDDHLPHVIELTFSSTLDSRALGNDAEAITDSSNQKSSSSIFQLDSFNNDLIITTPEIE